MADIIDCGHHYQAQRTGLGTSLWSNCACDHGFEQAAVQSFDVKIRQYVCVVPSQPSHTHQFHV